MNEFFPNSIFCGIVVVCADSVFEKYTNWIICILANYDYWPGLIVRVVRIYSEKYGFSVLDSATIDCWRLLDYYRK